MFTVVAALGCTRPDDRPPPPAATTDTLVYAAPDTAGVQVPPDLSAFCRPGIAQLRPSSSPHPAADAAGSVVSVTTIFKDSKEGVGQPVRCVVRRPEEWTPLWAALTRTFVSSQPSPPVEFGTRMVLVAGMGIRPSTGFSIGIESVHRTDDGLDATVVHYLPGGCEVGLAETEPVHVVAVPRHDGPVRFIEKIRYTPSDCTE